ncbi:hypothetical protein ACKP2L_05060 [Oenococcus alcoholitolerans]
MEKTVSIDGKEIKLLSSGVTPIIYKNAFGRDYFADVGTMIEAVSGTGKSKSDQQMVISLMKSGALTNIVNFLWAYAKNADGTIPKFEDWLRKFQNFAVLDFAEDVLDLIMSSLKTSKK